MAGEIYTTKSLCHVWRVVAVTRSHAIGRSRWTAFAVVTAPTWRRSEGDEEEWRLPAQRAHGQMSRLTAAAFIAVCSGGVKYGLRAQALPNLSTSSLKLQLSTAATQRRSEGDAGNNFFRRFRCRHCGQTERRRPAASCTTTRGTPSCTWSSAPSSGVRSSRRQRRYGRLTRRRWRQRRCASTTGCREKWTKSTTVTRRLMIHCC